MLVLAFDTATAAVTAVVFDCADGDARVLGSAAYFGAQEHGEQLAVIAAQAMSDAKAVPADLEAIVVGAGPGPFTGLRVGIVAGRVMGYALGITVHGVCSLDALAATAIDESAVNAGIGSRFAVAADARRREVYWATYEVAARGQATRIDGPFVSKPSDLPESVRLGRVVGRGTELYVDVFGSMRPPYEPTASGLATAAAWALDAGTTVIPEPMYLRRPDAVAWQS